MKATISEDVRQAARALRADGLSIRKIAGQLGIGVATTHRIVSDVKPGKASKPLPKQPVKSALPSSFDKFRELGASVGVEEPLLSAASDFVFRMGADQVKDVYSHLKGIVRVDLARSWAKLYGGFLNQELKTELDSSEADDRFSVVGQSIVRDPYGVSYNTALRELEIKLRPAEPDHKSSPLDEVERTLKMITGLKAAFGGNSSGGSIKLADGTLKIADFLSLKKFEADQEARVESDKRKMEIATEFRKLLTNVGKALGHMTEGEE